LKQWVSKPDILIMPIRLRLAVLVSLGLFSVRLAIAQDLAPRAYVITPLHSNP